MSGKNVNFGDKKSKKWLLEKQQSSQVDDIDVNKKLVSKEEPYGTKNYA